MARLDEITDLHRAYITARDKFRAHHGAKPNPFDFDNEEHLRWHITSERLVNASVKAEMAYRDAADAFFATTAPDLVQLLVDLDEHFEGRVDIDDNGGPNMAMRCVSMIEQLIGPRPANASPLPVRGLTRDEAVKQ
jgi:hypothetical protein